MNNKDNPADSLQSPERAPSMLDAVCGENGYDMILPEADGLTERREQLKATANGVEILAETKRQRDMLLIGCKRLLAIAQLCDSPDVFTTGARELLRAEVKQAETAIEECEGE